MTIAENRKSAMPTVRISKFRRKINRYLRMARSEPIRIIRHGSRHLVILSADRYDQMRFVT